jgi:beta-lactamase regulating signal transducer with metallopeptidase domain
MTGLVGVALSNLLVAAVLAAAAFTVGRRLRRPALTHGLWLLFFLKLVTPPLFPVSFGWRLGPTEATETRAGAEDAGQAALEDGQEFVEDPQALLAALEAEVRDLRKPLPVVEAANQEAEPRALTAGPEFPWATALAAVWLAGSACWFSLAGMRLWRFRRQLRFARPAPPILREQARQLAARLGVPCPDVWLLAGPVSPMLWVLGRTARLLVPAGLLERLEPEQSQALLAHELAHWRRRDHWVRSLELLVLGLYWWCPLVWWARGQMQEAEEECCDAWVLWLMPGAARGYALALVETVDFLAGARAALPPAASGIGHVYLLQRRLTMIMRGTTPRALTLGGVLAVLGLGALLLPLVPSWAQAPQAGGQTGGQAGQTEGQVGEEQQNPPRRGAVGEKRDQLQQAQEDLKRAQEALEKAKLDLDRKAKELQKRMAQLKRATDEADAADKKSPPARKYGASGQGGFWGFQSGQPGQPGLDLDKRLQQVERKLDLLIQLMTRKGPQPGGPPGPGVGGVGGGFPGGIPGGPGGGGGFPGGRGGFGGGGGLPAGPGGFRGAGGFRPDDPNVPQPGAGPRGKEQTDPNAPGR